MNPHHTHRPDNNRDEIVKALEAQGWTVFNTGGVGEGFPDCVVTMVVFTGETLNWYPAYIIKLVEIKNGNKPYTPKEQKFMEKHPGLVITVRSIEDVERLF